MKQIILLITTIVLVFSSTLIAQNVVIETTTPKVTLNGAANKTVLLGQDTTGIKQNIHPLGNVLDKISLIHGYTYQWKDTIRGTEEQIGFLAQEVEQQFPQLVHTDEEGMKSVAYSNMVPILLEAIKAQQIQIEELRQIIDERIR